MVVLLMSVALVGQAYGNCQAESFRKTHVVGCPCGGANYVRAFCQGQGGSSFHCDPTGTTIACGGTCTQFQAKTCTSSAATAWSNDLLQRDGLKVSARLDVEASSCRAGDGPSLEEWLKSHAWSGKRMLGKPSSKGL